MDVNSKTINVMEKYFSKTNNYKIILMSILTLLGVSLFLILYFIESIKFEIAFVDSSITSVLFILLAYVLWYPTKFINIESFSFTNIAINNFFIIILSSILLATISYFSISSVYPDYEAYYLSTLPIRFTVGTLLIAIIIIMNYVIVFYNNLTKKVIAESQFNSLITEAELKSLKYQINPHFIFNSLNSISSLTISNPEKAQEMTINLSEFLRKVLANNDIKKVSLEEEIKNIELYLKIEKVRFENRLEFSLNLSEDCKNILIPNMILQPLFENSIKHGVYESSETIFVELNCQKIDNFIRIKISNVFDPHAVNKFGEGIGLQNINSRLKLIYNMQNLISTQKTDNIFTVNLLIPVEEA